MLDLDRDLGSPPELLRASDCFASGKGPANPITSDQSNGVLDLSIQPGDEISFHMLLSLVDRLECIDDIREGLKEIEEGKTIPLEQVKEEERLRYGIPL